MSYQRNKRNHKNVRVCISKEKESCLRINVRKSRISSRRKYERSYAEIPKENSQKLTQ